MALKSRHFLNLSSLRLLALHSLRISSCTDLELKARRFGDFSAVARTLSRTRCLANER